MSEATAKCCCHCEKCRIFFDGFTRSQTGTGTGSGTSTTNLGSNWSEILGDWFIVDNKLRVEVSDALVTVIDPEHATPYVWSFDFKADDYADEIRAYVGISGSTKLYAQVRIHQPDVGTGSGTSNLSCGELSLHDETGHRFASVYVPGMTKDAWHTLRVCLNFVQPDEYEYGIEEKIGTLSALVISSDKQVSRAISYSPIDASYDNVQVGIGTGSISNAVEFDNACWQRMRTTEDSIGYESPPEEPSETGTGTGFGVDPGEDEVGTGTGTFTIPAEPECPFCGTADICTWGNLYVEEFQLGTTIPPEIYLRIPCDWQVVTGTPWTPVAKFEGQVSTNDSESTLKFMSSAPNDTFRQRITSAVMGSTEDSKALFYLNYTADGISRAARLTFHNTCGKVELLLNGAVVETLNIEPLETNKWHFICLSYDGETFKADVGVDVEDLHLMGYFGYRHIGTSGEENTGTAFAVEQSPYVAIGVEDNTGTVFFKKLAVSLPYHPVYHPVCYTCDNCSLSKPASSADVAVGCEWNPVSGLISDTGLAITLSGSGSLAAYKGNDGSDNGYAEWSFVAKQTGQILRTYINADVNGAPSGPWAQITVNDAGNSPLLLSTGQTKATTARPNVGHNMRICLDGTTIRVNYDVNLGFIPPVNASTVGILSEGATGRYLIHQLLGSGGEAEFWSSYYSKMRVTRPLHYPHTPVVCARCFSKCECCLNQLSPTTFLVSLSNFKNSGFWSSIAPFNACCDMVNGDYYLEGGDCGWAFDPDVPGFVNENLCPSHVGLTFNCGGGGGPGTTTLITGTVIIRRNFPSLQPDTIHVFKRTVDNPIDCMNLNGLELLFDSIATSSNSICTQQVIIPGVPPVTTYPDPPRFILSAA